MTYRILGLDGGGSWALIEVKALITLFGEATAGHDVLRHFDLVAANSGGSIVLGGLVENLTLKQILGFFMDQDKRQAVFSPTSSWGDDILEGILKFGPKYSAAAKLAALETLMPITGALPVSGITAGIPGHGGGPARLMIVGFDYDYNRATFFRSVRPSVPALGLMNSAKITLAEAIHASTNAPINYFDAPASFPEHGERYWDGGVTGFNNPILAAVTEALTLGVAPQEIAALSLGTATQHLLAGLQGQKSSAFVSPWTASNLKNDLQKMASSILDDPPDSASFIAHAATKSGAPIPAPAISRVVRMNPVISPVLSAGALAAPGNMTPAAFQALAQIGMDAVKPAEVTAISDYADLWLNDIAPNQLLHSDGQTLAQKTANLKIGAVSAAVPNPDPDRDPPSPATDFGHLTFSAALAAWTAIS